MISLELESIRTNFLVVLITNSDSEIFKTNTGISFPSKLNRFLSSICNFAFKSSNKVKISFPLKSVFDLLKYLKNQNSIRSFTCSADFSIKFSIFCNAPQRFGYGKLGRQGNFSFPSGLRARAFCFVIIFLF